MSDIDEIINDALRTRYAIAIDDNYENIQEACNYLATLPKNSIVVFAWHRLPDLRLQSAAFRNGLIIEDLMQQDEWTIKLVEWSSGATDYPIIRKHLMLRSTDILIAWYKGKPKSIKSIIRLAKVIGVTVIENPTTPKQMSMFD